MMRSRCKQRLETPDTELLFEKFAKILHRAQIEKDADTAYNHEVGTYDYDLM